MQAVSNEAKAVEVAATFQTIEEAATQLDGAREEAAATMDAVAQVRLCGIAEQRRYNADHPMQLCAVAGCYKACGSRMTPSTRSWPVHYLSTGAKCSTCAGSPDVELYAIRCRQQQHSRAW
jgi:hypothetical protein